MLLPADFLPNFADCKTHREVETTYKSLYRPEIRDSLMEALRLSHVRIVEERDKPATSGITRTRRDNSDVNDTAVRSWARLTGYVMPASGQVTNAVRDAYREAKGMTVQAPSVIPVPQDVPVATIREWCRQNGVQVGLKGRLKPEVIQAYREAHENE